MNVSFQEAQRFLLATWQNRDKVTPPTVFLIGPPGIGKSAVPAAVVKDMGPNAQLVVLDLTSRLPEDIGGLPFRDGGQTCYSPQEWAWRMSQPDAVGCIVFDDLPAASSATAAAVRQIVLDRRINGTVIAPGVLIVVTGNRREDLSGALTLPAHFRNAVCILEMEPKFDSWCTWFVDRGGDPTILSFLRWRPGAFSSTPDKADARGRFATPRSWTLLANSLPAAKQAQCLPQIVMGFVGEGSCTEFMAFHETVSQLPDMGELFRNPKQIMPKPQDILTTPDRLVAVSNGLTYVLIRELKTVKREGQPIYKSEDAVQLMTQWFKALHWVISDNVEYAAAAISDYMSMGGSHDLLRVCVHAEKNKAVTKLMDNIRSLL
jgi:hypothetical protein